MSRLPTGLESLLMTWDGRSRLPIFYGPTDAKKLARNADTVRHAMRRLGIEGKAKANIASESVIVSPKE